MYLRTADPRQVVHRLVTAALLWDATTRRGDPCGRPLDPNAPAGRAVARCKKRWDAVDGRYNRFHDAADTTRMGQRPRPARRNPATDTPRHRRQDRRRSRIARPAAAKHPTLGKAVGLPAPGLRRMARHPRTSLARDKAVARCGRRKLEATTPEYPVRRRPVAVGTPDDP